MCNTHTGHPVWVSFAPPGPDVEQSEASRKRERERTAAERMHSDDKLDRVVEKKARNAGPHSV